jgi:hypothetical protein
VCLARTQPITTSFAGVAPSAKPADAQYPGRADRQCRADDAE